MTDSSKKSSGVTDVSLASEVSRDVELLAILLRSARLESSVTDLSNTATFGTKQQFRATYERSHESNQLRIVLAFSLVLQESNDEQKDVLRLTAEYQALYQVPDGKEYSSEALQYFAQLNGALNVWPYWRELVHSVVARVGLGSLTLPVFRVKPTPIEAKEQPTTAAD